MGPGLERFVEGDAARIDVEEGKAGGFGTLDQRGGDAIRVSGEQPRDERGLVREREQGCVERSFKCPRGAGLCDSAGAAAGRGLSFGQSIDGIVEQQIIDVDVPPGHVREMPSANGKSVSVSANGKHG